jgi:excisionase family DNA binding protein
MPIPMMDWMDPFAALTAEWANQATTPAARQAIQAWTAGFPALASFDTPAELVAAINRAGDPTRSCALLSYLLVVAGHDDLAARAVLQAVLPGLRRAAQRRWQQTSAGGPWPDPNELAADAISAGWEAIQVHAGQPQQRPAAVIVRGVEGRLRRTHDNWRRRDNRTRALHAELVETVQYGTDAVYSAETQATAIIAEASRAHVLDPSQAALIFATGVAGHSVADAGRAIGIPNGAAYRILRPARAALRSWLDDSSDLDNLLRQPGPQGQPERAPNTRLLTVVDRSPTSRNATAIPLTALHLNQPLEDPLMLPLLLTPNQAAQLLGISRSKLYTLINSDQIESVTIDTSRRIPYAGLLDYIDSLRHQQSEAGRSIGQLRQSRPRGRPPRIAGDLCRLDSQQLDAIHDPHGPEEVARDA